MNLFKRLFLAATMKEPEWWKQTGLMVSTSSGKSVSPDDALQIVAVYACVRIIAESTSSLPVHVYKNTERGREIVRSHPLNYLLGASPNGEQTAFELREFLMACLLLRGNSYCQIIRKAGKIHRIEPLNAKYIKPGRTEGGKLFFDYAAPDLKRVFNENEIWRIAGFGSNGVTGQSPITLARESLGVSMAVEEQAAKMFSNGAQIPGVLEFPGTLKTEQIDNLRKQIAEKHTGSENAHKPLILESGMKYSKIGMSADDAQFLESRKFQINDIARIFRVPPHMVGDLEKATFSNIEHQSIEYVMHTIRPWLVRFEQSIMRDLFTDKEKKELFVSFNVDGLLRGDIKSRYEAYGKGITDGWLNRNEARGLENLNHVDGLDEYLTPLNMATTTDREQQLNDSASNALAEKEIKALSFELEKLTPDEFKDWSSDFYNRFKKSIINLKCCTDSQAQVYIDNRINSIKENPLQAVPYILDNCKKELEALGYE